MALQVKDRVLDATTTGGTGPFTLTGAVIAGYVPFSSASAGLSVNDTFYGAIVAVDANDAPTGSWVTGLMTYSAVNQVTVTTITQSSNANAAVSFAAGATKLVYIDATAEYSALREVTANKDVTGGYAGLTLLKINFKNALNTFTSFFTNSNTAARTYTFKDADGTIAFTSDITGINSGTNTGDQTSVSGNAGTATTLATARAINGVNFDGSAAITVPVNSADDTTNVATMYPLWTSAVGNTAAKISTTKLSFVPNTGILTATGYVGTYNGNTFTTGTGILTIAASKTLTASNTLTFTGIDSSSVAFGTGGTVAYTANKLSAFAATTSAELAGVISDETGTNKLVFSDNPTFASLTNSGDISFTGTGNRITGDFSNATRANRVSWQTSTANGISVVQVLPNGTATTAAWSVHNKSDPDNAGFLTAQITSTEGNISVQKTGGGVFLPLQFSTNSSAQLLIGTDGTATFTQNVVATRFTSNVATGTAPLTVASTTNVVNLNASSLNGATFSSPGAIGGTVASSGAFTSISGTTVNCTSFTNSTSGTVLSATTTTDNTTTSQSGYQATSSTNNRLQMWSFALANTTSHCGTTLGGWAALYTTGANNAGLMIDTQTAVPIVMGTNNTENFRIASGGAITISSTLNKYTFTAPATAATLTIANNKTLTCNNSITFAGTDSTTMTFPSTSATVARTDAGNTFTGDQKLGTAGNGIYIKEGSNATMGVATMVLGTIVVNTTKVTANSRIFLTPETLGTVTVPTAVAVTARTAGTSFTITSANATDTSTVAWVILEPA